MNLTDSDILKFMKGTPVFLEDICAIFPATIGEIVDIGYNNFQQYLGTITAVKPVGKKGEEEINKIIEQLTDFQYILLFASIDKNLNNTLKESFRFFCREEVIFSLDPAQIIIGPIEEKHILDEDKFYDLQRIIRKMYFLDDGEEEIIINKDDTLAVREIKLKMRENREKLRRAKAKESSNKGNDLKFSDLIGSITINNCGLNIENIWNITYYAFHDQLKRMGWRDQFNINNQAAMAGAKIKKSQLKHWIRSINNSDNHD